MSDSITRIETRFHALIRERANDLASGLELPLLQRDVPMFEERWFPVPGMVGGFAYALHDEPEGPVPIVESWSRVVGGSGQRHRITAQGCTLLEEGFV
jgi:hypothetical protein